MLTIPAAPAPSAAPLVIVAPNCGDLVQQAYIAVHASSPQGALMLALDALDAHADQHGYTASIETYATYGLADGRYLVVTN